MRFKVERSTYAEGRGLVLIGSVEDPDNLWFSTGCEILIESDGKTERREVLGIELSLALRDPPHTKNPIGVVVEPRREELSEILKERGR